MQVTAAGHQLVDGAELGRRLGVCRTTIWRLAHTGRIPYYCIGRRWLFSEPEVVEALRVPADVKPKQLPAAANDNHHR